MRYFQSPSGPDVLQHPYVMPAELSLNDVEAVRLMLRGDSIIDWHRMSFTSRSEIDAFLRVNLFEPDSPEDQRRFRYLHQEAVQYLRNHYNLRMPPQLIDPTDVRELFEHASFAEPRFNRMQVLSCMILKVMSILHHIEARALLFRTRISDYDLFALVQDRVDAFYEAAQRADVPLVQIFGSRKSRDSLITKLLSKRDTIAATIFDKLRYRIVVEQHQDLLPALAYMTRTFLPFNYTIPSESTNNLLTLGTFFETRPDLVASMSNALSNYRLDTFDSASQTANNNVFSGSSYRMINFIVDLPVRVDSFLTDEDILRYGRIAFVLVEFQLVDQGTEDDNERGENSHERYKQRQRDKVMERLRGASLLKTLRVRKPVSEENS